MTASAPRSSSSDVPSGYAVDPSKPPMLRFEASLPRLPVPTLASTAAKYLESVKPHLDAAAFASTERAVGAFLASPLSKQLQERLERRAGQEDMQNWLAEWWNDAAYMAYRDPVVVFVSYFYVHLADKRVTTGPKRAAQLVKAFLPFRQMVESGALEPEKVRGMPLSMDSYKWLFHSSRYPTKPSDTARKFDHKTHNHIVVVRKNRFFKIPLANERGEELSAAEFEVQFERVLEQAGKEKAPAVGALTSDNRDRWTEARDALAANPTNAGSLEQIESAMIVVCLDDTSPVTREDVSWGCWTGDGRNRWYDKHQLIVFENGKSGFLGEHSCMDGTPTLRLNEFALASLAAGRTPLGASRTDSTGSDLAPPTLLTFDLTNTTLGHIRASEEAFDKLIGQHDLSVLHYEGYGSGLAKKMKTSPDAWAQMVMQLAWHKAKNRPGVCYESAQTRKFKLGRTEVIRSASNESKEWAQAMLDPEQTDVQRAALFRRAVSRHLQYAAWAADGQGVDRHLFGLKRMLQEGEATPELHADPAYARTSHWEMSTSQLSSPFMDGWGYGEVVPDGYGLAYSIADKHIRWTVTSLGQGADSMRHYLAEAATETREMMERATAAEDGNAKL